MTNFFSNQLGSTFLTTPEEMSPFLKDASRLDNSGSPLGVLVPMNTEEVSQALKWAHANNTPVAIRGAGTGVSGGAVAYDRGLTISLHQMNSILEIDQVNRTAWVESGVVTQELDIAAREFGLTYPPDPASYETSTIGGNIATNAGGLRCMKYGNTKDYVRRLEVVLANGDIIDVGSRTIKDSTGLNIMPLFIGSEGTLGVITRALVKLIDAPKGSGASFRMGFASTLDACKAIHALKFSALDLDVLELLDAVSVRTIVEHFPHLELPGDQATLIGHSYETNPAAMQELLTTLAPQVNSMSFEVSRDQHLLDIRRLANPALTAEGLMSSCDVAVPLDKIALLCEKIEALAQARNTRISIVAHAGDGNFHPTVETDGSPESLMHAEEILEEIEILAIQMGGVISGEHGIGALKLRSLEHQFNSSELQVQRNIKTALDPKNILSPGRVIA